MKLSYNEHLFKLISLHKVELYHSCKYFSCFLLPSQAADIRQVNLILSHQVLQVKSLRSQTEPMCHVLLDRLVVLNHAYDRFSYNHTALTIRAVTQK